MITRSMPSTLSAAVIAALMLATAGCSGSAGTIERAAPSASSAGSSSAGTSSPTPNDGQKDPVDNGAASAGIDPINPPKPIASVTAPLPYRADQEATGRFDIYSIKRQGKLAILTMSVTPTFSTKESPSLYSLLGAAASFSPELVDPINLRVYTVVRATNGPLSTNPVRSRTSSGRPLFIWAAFAAPPANVTKLNLNVHDSVPPFMDVPVQ